MAGETRAPLMPRTEDFPVHAQDALRAEQPSGERGASGLFSKLTRAVSGSQPHGHAPAARPASDEPARQQVVARPASAPQAPLDQHGRPVSAHPVAAPASAQPSSAAVQPAVQPASRPAQPAPSVSARMDDDLEIPAFLRRSRG